MHKRKHTTQMYYKKIILDILKNTRHYIKIKPIHQNFVKQTDLRPGSHDY